jgi:NADH:ubiquinone oxidoreductase subunit 3 (subunit A)
MLRIAARYFTEKRGNGQPIDSVARFHLRNGARLERINWLGDTSPKGLKQSAGIMVNYRYLLGEIEKNHEAYANQGEIAASTAHLEDARGRFDVRYYLVAILFIIFDLEVAFLFPWAVAFGDLGWFGFWSMMVFLGVLTVGFIYEWKKGALEWE